jgi:hypothetical protein
MLRSSVSIAIRMILTVRFVGRVCGAVIRSVEKLLTLGELPVERATEFFFEQRILHWVRLAADCACSFVSVFA